MGQAAEIRQGTRRLRRLATSLCLVFLALLGVSARAEARSAITVAIDDTYPPYIFRDEAGNLQGILKDMWDAWSRKTGIRVNLAAQDWARAQAMMAAGEADVIDTIFETPSRLEKFDFSPPYATIDVPIYFHATISGISGVDTLRGFTIGVKDGDACIDWLERRGIKSFRRHPSYEAMIEAASKLELRIFCLDQPPGDYLLYKRGLDPQFRHTAPLYSGQFHWAVRKGDQALYRLISDGFSRIDKAERDQIEAKWLGATLNRVDARRMEFITWGLAAAAGGALVLGAWSWTLRRKVAARTRQATAALDALQRSESHYRELVGLTPVGVFETDSLGRCVFVNERWSRVTGLGAEQAMGVGWAECLHPDDALRVAREWDAARGERGLFQSEFRFPPLGPSGQPTWVLGQIRAKRDVTGQVTGHIGTITDITAAKSAESALAASEARFRAIFDNINDAIIIIDMADWTVVSVNNRMAEMYGYDAPAQMVGQKVETLCEGPPPHDAAAAQAWREKAASGEPQCFEWRSQARNGRIFWIEAHLRLVRVGSTDRLLGVLRDISQRKEAERVLEERTEELQRSNADLEQFAYVASHDLREPLRMVSSYMALLERRYHDRLDKDGLDFLGFAKEGATRMDRLVRDLLEFSRVGRTSEPMVATQLDLVVGNVAKVLRGLMEEAGAELRIPAPLPVVTCSGNDIFLLFQNLISNAVKFRSPDRSPVVTITAEREGARWKISVADNGIGIEPSYFDRIFKIFHRLHTRDAYDGTGIGLSICKKIVERHGGRIWVESKLGDGARFHFTLEGGEGQ